MSRLLARSTVDPRVRILQGRFDENPGWPEGEFENQNNHSLITRIDFGTARAIYATGWDGNVRVVARAANDITVYREH